jgi:hypothetical protein
VVCATQALKDLCKKFEEELLGIFPKPAAPPEDEEAYSEVSEGEDYFKENGSSNKEKSDDSVGCKGPDKRKKTKKNDVKKIFEKANKTDDDIGK